MLDHKQYFNFNIYIIFHRTASHTFYSVFCSQFCFWFLAFFTCFFFFFLSLFFGCLLSIWPWGPGERHRRRRRRCCRVFLRFASGLTRWSWLALKLFTIIHFSLTFSLSLSASLVPFVVVLGSSSGAAQIRHLCQRSPTSHACMHHITCGQVIFAWAEKSEITSATDSSREGGWRGPKGVCVCVDVAA